MNPLAIPDQVAKHIMNVCEESINRTELCLKRCRLKGRAAQRETDR